MYRKTHAITTSILMLFALLLSLTTPVFACDEPSLPDSHTTEEMQKDDSSLATAHTAEELQEMVTNGINCQTGENDILISEPLALTDNAPVGIRLGHPVGGQIRVQSGATLQISAPQLILYSNSPAPLIVVEAGGSLILEAGKTDYFISDPSYKMILVENGGSVTVGANFTLDARSYHLPPILLEDGANCDLQNNNYKLAEDVKGDLDGIVAAVPDSGQSQDPDDGGTPPTDPSDKPGDSGDSDNSDDHDDSNSEDVPDGPTPQPPACSAEFVQTKPAGIVHAYLTIPRLDETVMCIFVGQHRSETDLEIKFDFFPDDDAGENMILFSSETSEPISEYYPTVFSWDDPNDPTKSYLHYVDSYTTPDEVIQLHVKIVYWGKPFESFEVSFTMPDSPAATEFVGKNDYGDIDGNRGGGGQGESDRNPLPTDPVNPSVPPSTDGPSVPDNSITPENPGTSPETPEVAPDPQPETRPDPDPGTDGGHRPHRPDRDPQPEPEEMPDPEPEPEETPDTSLPADPPHHITIIIPTPEETLQPEEIPPETSLPTGPDISEKPQPKVESPAENPPIDVQEKPAPIPEEVQPEEDPVSQGLTDTSIYDDAPQTKAEESEPPQATPVPGFVISSVSTLAVVGISTSAILLFRRHKH